MIIFIHPTPIWVSVKRKCGADSFICSEVLEYLWSNKQYSTPILGYGAWTPHSKNQYKVTSVLLFLTN